MSEPVVSICSITYNHAPYIRQCLDGFLMQKTNFPFEIIINDDCSTDGTTEIIKEYAEKYPDLIKPIFHEENQYKKGVRGMFVKYVFPKAQGKYLALCEGDDYWIDPLKLQKQVEILEQNPEIGMIYTGFDTINEKGNVVDVEYFKKYIERSKTGDVFRTLLNGNFIMTLTTCFRRECICSKYLYKAPSFVDYSCFVCAALFWKVYYLRDITGCYRITSTGAMATRAEEVNSAIEESYLYYSSLYVLGKSRKRSLFESMKIYLVILRHLLKLSVDRKSVSVFRKLFRYMAENRV